MMMPSSMRTAVMNVITMSAANVQSTHADTMFQAPTVQHVRVNDHDHIKGR